MKRLLLLLLVLAPAAPGAPVPQASFQASVTAYDAGNYPEAISRLSEVLAADGESAVAHYNLGDAYFREKQLGRAVFHFRKALSLLPRDPDIRFNLAYVRKKAVDKITDRRLLPSIGAWLPLSERETYYLVLFFSFAFAVAGMASLHIREPAVRWARHAFLVAALLSLVLCAQKSFFAAPFGVIISPEVEVYSGIGKDNVLLFKLHEGTEFTVGDRDQAEWVQISLADGKKGWVKKKDVVF